MNTTKIVIDKNYKGLIDEGWRYKIEGDINCESLEIDLNKGLYVTGSIKAGEYIQAGGFIEAGEYIQAGWSIKAGEYIQAGWSIKAAGSIKAGEYIQAGGFIEAGEYIQAGWSIEAERSIKAGWYIKAGDIYGVSAGLSITCEGCLSFGLKAFAGVCTWKNIEDEDKTITCSKLEGGGVVEYGILKETGEQVEEVTMEQVCEKFGRNVKIIKL